MGFLIVRMCGRSAGSSSVFVVVFFVGGSCESADEFIAPPGLFRGLLPERIDLGHDRRPATGQVWGPVLSLNLYMCVCAF